MGRPTAQSSTYDNSWDYDISKASNAVDGNYKQCETSQKSVSQTKIDKAPWWLVVLDGVYKVNTVILYSPTEYPASLSNINIYVEDFGGKKSLCATTGSIKDIPKKEFTCRSSAVGNVVFLQKEGRGTIKLCEIKVYGDRGL